MNITESSKWLLVISAIYAAVSAPTIFLSNPHGWSLAPFRATQPFAAAICLAASLLYLWRTRHSRVGASRWLTIGVAAASALWLAIFVFLAASLDFSMMD